MQIRIPMLIACLLLAGSQAIAEKLSAPFRVQIVPAQGAGSETVLQVEVRGWSRIQPFEVRVDPPSGAVLAKGSGLSWQGALSGSAQWQPVMNIRCLRRCDGKWRAVATGQVGAMKMRQSAYATVPAQATNKPLGGRVRTGAHEFPSKAGR